MYELAEHLHKTVEEVGAMPTTEYVGWRAYFDVVAWENEQRADDGTMRWVRPPWEVKRRG